MLYFDMVDALSTMEDAQAGALFKALMAYARYGEVQPLSGLAAFAFHVVRPRIDQDAETYAEKCRRNGYAVYLREAQRRQEQPLEYEVWCRQTSDDIERYPTQRNSKNNSKNNSNNNHSAAEVQSSTGRAAADSPTEDDKEFSFSPYVKSRIEEWLRYKTERQEPYTATGWKNLLARLHSSIERYGETAVAELMRECMASGYRSIVFDRLEKGDGAKPRKQKTEDDQAWMREYVELNKKRRAAKGG